MILSCKRVLKYTTLLVFTLLLGTKALFANHLVGADLNYQWQTGNTYKITLTLYGDCGSAGSTSAYANLSVANPRICIYDGSTSITSINLSIQPPSDGVEITPVCPADSLNTQCHLTSSTIPGIKRFIYSGTYTVPYTSHFWRFMFNGFQSTGASAGRATTITNITGGVSTMQLIDTLDNTTPLPNSSPILTILPVPFFCVNANSNYNPGAVDADGDSLVFNLIHAPETPSTNPCVGTSNYVNYVTTYPYSGANPLHTYAGAFSFDPLTGQISFTPDIIQRSLAVYNIREYRNGVLIGSSMREMTFKTLTCTGTPPRANFTSSSGGTVEDSTHYRICANSGAFSVSIAGVSDDPTKNLTLTTTGVPMGATFSVTGNGTPNPVATVSWTSTGVTTGFYTFFVNVKDDNCPISNQQTLAFTIAILPIPGLSSAIVQPVTCTGDAIIAFTPSGDGLPWHTQILDASGNVIDSTLAITGTFYDTLPATADSIIIYSNLSMFCNGRYDINLPAAAFVTPIPTMSNPTYCGANDGFIKLSGLNPGELDTIRYTYMGTFVNTQVILVPTSGEITLSNLCAGTYSNIVVSYGRCRSTPLPPIVLTNPAITIGTVTATNVSSCGFNNGKLVISGLQPGQVDSLFYTYNSSLMSPVVATVSASGTITLNGMPAGTYSNIYVKTLGNCPNYTAGCISPILGPITIQQPELNASFIYNISQGCKGDTLRFTNLSTSDSNFVVGSTAGLSYRWYFSDGGTDTAKNPTHVYLHLASGTYSAKLIITNTECVDSMMVTFTLNEKISAGFTVPSDTVCQQTPITFTNTSTGLGLSYAWDMGDGTTASSLNVTHPYNNTGLYLVKLIVQDNIPCYDTAEQYIQIDSIAQANMSISDTTICSGGMVTVGGIFTNIGLTSIVWNLGDGNIVDNTNSVQHSFTSSTPTSYFITVTASYRACPTATTTRKLRVYPIPNIYLGADTSLCAGGGQVYIMDRINSGNPLATWEWNTGDNTSSIVATKPGIYTSKVTIYGCVASDTLEVARDCYIDLPNSFSPNDDGVNDYFFPRSLLTHGLTSFTLNIYNRWGQLVYETKATEGKGWDGRFNDTPQPQGVYIYYIHATFKDGQRVDTKGNVTLLR